MCLYEVADGNDRADDGPPEWMGHLPCEVPPHVICDRNVLLLRTASGIRTNKLL
jgi:hypothetical protein